MSSVITPLPLLFKIFRLDFKDLIVI